MTTGTWVWDLYTIFNISCFWPPRSGQKHIFCFFWRSKVIFISPNCYLCEDNSSTIQKMQEFLKSDTPERRYWSLTIFGTRPNCGLKAINCRLWRHLATNYDLYISEKNSFLYTKYYIENILFSLNISYWWIFQTFTWLNLVFCITTSDATPLWLDKRVSPVVTQL